MENLKNLTTISRELALAGLQIGAIKINPDKPFLWASGTYNPIYNDNRMFLYYPELRKLIINGFILLINEIQATNANYIPDIIAGTSTAGIPHGYGLAQELNLPFIYIRDEPKKHGMKNQIEGIDSDKHLNGDNVLLIEDLISTGGSSVKAVQAIRNANGSIDSCFSIFNYDLWQAKSMFKGEIAFNKSTGEKLTKICNVFSLIHYSNILQLGIEHKYINKQKENLLNEWIEDQENWGDKNGFPRVQK